jgi:type II secretory pathway pseudopilin PulG
VKSTVFTDEKGTSLVELLVSLAIIAIIFTTLLSALSTASFGSAEVRERVTAENLARAQLECIQDHPYIIGASPISYTTVCTVTTTSTPSYHTHITSISYWDWSNFTSDPEDDGGMQWITVTVSHNGEPIFTIADYKVDQ